MPEITIRVGGRPYLVACQEGEEGFLESAAALLDGQATLLTDQIGNLPENRLLLMAGLMVSDQMAAMKDGGAPPVAGDAGQIAVLTAQVAQLEADLKAAHAAVQAKDGELAAAQAELTDAQTELAAVKDTAPTDAEVPNYDTLEELTVRAEALADRVEGNGSV